MISEMMLKDIVIPVDSLLKTIVHEKKVSSNMVRFCN